MSILDLSNIRTKIEFMNVLGAFFSFPESWGMNWDACNDCLGDSQMSILPSHIEIIGGENLQKNCPEDIGILLEILDENNIKYSILPSLQA